MLINYTCSVGATNISWTWLFVLRLLFHFGRILLRFVLLMLMANFVIITKNNLVKMWHSFVICNMFFFSLIYIVRVTQGFLGKLSADFRLFQGFLRVDLSVNWLPQLSQCRRRVSLGFLSTLSANLRVTQSVHNVTNGVFSVFIFDSIRVFFLLQ